jgi:glyoxalase family protein
MAAATCGRGDRGRLAMTYSVDGIHHVTAGAAAAQEDIDFFTQAVGQRMIKQTVLFDGVTPIYHLYYANKNAEIGSVMTTFPFKQAGLKGRKGSGQIKTIGFSVPPGSLGFWRDHFKRHGVAHGEIAARFGAKTLHFSHPAGLEFEMIEEADDKREAPTTAEVSAEVASRGIHSAVMSVRDIEEQVRFLVDGLGFRKDGTDGAYTRLTIGKGGATKIVDLLHEPDLPQGSWTFAQGLVHHIAFAVPTEKEQSEIKAHLEGIGYTDVSEIKDRNYFHSIYCRSPGGILCEVATSDIGFAVDEPKDRLGEKLLLPPWFEPRRAEIIAPLEPIRVPAAQH